MKHLYKRAPIDGKSGYLNFDGEFIEDADPSEEPKL